MKLLKVSISLIALMLLVSCAQKPVKELVKAPNTAVVVIGMFGDMDWQFINSSDPVIDQYIYPDAKYDDAFLMPVTVGTDFRVTGVERSTAKRKLSVEYPNSHAIKIEKKGIYYYGVIETKAENGVNVRSRVTSRVEPRAIEIVKQKYPEVFKELPSINF